jgi:hypothetical protein
LLLSKIFLGRKIMEREDFKGATVSFPFDTIEERLKGAHDRGVTRGQKVLIQFLDGVYEGKFPPEAVTSTGISEEMHNRLQAMLKILERVGTWSAGPTSLRRTPVTPVHRALTLIRGGKGV